MTLTLFTLTWIIGALLIGAVYVWDWREARKDGSFVNMPPPGMTERRARPQSHMIVRGDVLAALCYLIGQVSALLVGLVSLLTPVPAAIPTLTLRSIVLSVGFIVLELMTGAGGVVRIYVRRWLRQRHATEVAAAHVNGDPPVVNVK